MAGPRIPDEKTKSLREHGVFNRHPGDVQDELFRDSDFFDARDLVQVRYEMLRRARTEGRPVSEAAARFGVSRPTYYKVNADFEREGLPGLVPRKRGPKAGHKLTDEVVDKLQRALDDDPSLDSSALVALAREKLGIQVHRRSVERALQRQKKNGSDAVALAADRSRAGDSRRLRTATLCGTRHGRADPWARSRLDAA